MPNISKAPTIITTVFPAHLVNAHIAEPSPDEAEKGAKPLVQIVMTSAVPISTETIRPVADYITQLDAQTAIDLGEGLVELGREILGEGPRIEVVTNPAAAAAMAAQAAGVDRLRG